MNDEKEILNQSKKELSNGKFEMAIQLLNEKMVGKFSNLEYNLIILNGRANRLKDDNFKGILSQSEYTIERNRISELVLNLIQEIESELNKNFKISTISIENLTEKHPDWNDIIEMEVEVEDLNQIQEENIKEAMEEIKKMLSNFIPELKNFSGNFHEKLISQVRDENLFKIVPKRVFVFGKSNAGKTTTINNLLKSDVFNIESFPASDDFSLTQTLNCGEHEGGLIIYDSPGIGDKSAPDNITRAALSIKQKEKKQVTEIIIIDATKNKKEGDEKFSKLNESEILTHLNKEAYFKYQDNIIGKKFQIPDFQHWAKSKFDFYIFVVSCGWSKGLNEKQIEFLVDFYTQIGKEQKVFKIINILNDRKQSRYKDKFEEFDIDIKNAYNNVVKEFKINDFPNPEDWIFVESNFGTGFDKVIDSMAKSLSPDTLISIEKAINSDYSYLIHYKIDEFYFRYISFIASIVGCYPVDFWIEGNSLLSYSIKSMFLISEYIYQDSKNINPNILDNLIKKIKKDKKDYKDVGYYKPEIKNEQVYVGTGVEALDIIRTYFGYETYMTVTKEEKVLQKEEKKYYRIGGQLAITTTLAIGIALYEVYRGKKVYSESEFLSKINQLHVQISKDFIPIYIPEKLRKYKHKQLRTAKINEIQPKIEDFTRKYLQVVK